MAAIRIRKDCLGSLWEQGWCGRVNGSHKCSKGLSTCCNNTSKTVIGCLTFPIIKHEKSERLWRDLMADPSNWVDYRSGKPTPRFPDFKHKRSGEALWLDGKWTPQWVKSEIATLQTDCPDQPWHDLLSQPSKWWDHRSRKQTSKFPDFINKQNGEALWLNGILTPPWVQSKVVATLGSAVLEVDTISSVQTMSRYNKEGQFSLTLKCFEQMQRKGKTPDHYIFLHVLDACSALGALSKGRLIHRQIVEADCECHPHIGSSLVNMYAKCGSLEDAWNMFDKMPTRNVVAWTAMIQGCVKAGQGNVALELFSQMQKEGVEANPITFVALLNACASVAALGEGRQFHKQIVEHGWESNPYVSSSLVDMYAKCGSLQDALNVFDKMLTRDVVAWNAMIMGCLNGGQGHMAFELFYQMQREGIQANPITFMALINACARVKALEKGRQVHELIVEHGCESDLYVSSSLLHMYAKCGSLREARNVFDKMPTRDVVAWNSMMMGCLNGGQAHVAFELFAQMKSEEIEPNSVTFLALLNACANVAALKEGRQVHKLIVEHGCESDPYVCCSLVDMYAKCGSLEDARNLLDKIATHDVVAWTAMIQGCVKGGQGQLAMGIYAQMQKEGVVADSTTFVALLNACASVSALEGGRQIHKQIFEHGFETDPYVCSSLVDMYAKCGSLEDARNVFDKMPTRNVVAWSAMILGCVKGGEGHMALQLLAQMRKEGVDANPITFVALLNACASIGALEDGRQLHREIIAHGCESNTHVSSSLVDMYAKCGSLEDARNVFHKILRPDVVACNAMLMGFAMHGFFKDAVALFEEMTISGLEISEVTFIGLLSACSHGFRVKEGLQYFKCMLSVYGVTPTQHHYTIMVDILGRAGLLEEAEAMVNGMPLEPCAAIWRSLLGSCRIHGNVEMGERAFKRVTELDPSNSAGYVLLSNMYASVGSFESKQPVQKERF